MIELQMTLLIIQIKTILLHYPHQILRLHDFQTQQTSRQTPHSSPEQGSSNTQTAFTVQFQKTSPTTQPNVPTLAYTPAQNTQAQNIQTALTINTLHFNAIPNYTTSRKLSRDLHYKLFQLTHYRTAVSVQITIIHNIVQQTISTSTP